MFFREYASYIPVFRLYELSIDKTIVESVITWKKCNPVKIRFDKDLRTCVEHRATLRHQMGVGAVRFAPQSSTYLATAADDSIIIIWKYEPDRKPLQEKGFYFKIWKVSLNA